MSIYSERTSCAKCGFGMITTSYDGERDMIRRRCARCGYGWLEQTLDAERKPTPDLERLLRKSS